MLIFFWFLNSNVSWAPVSENCSDLVVDFKSTVKMFSVDFIRLPVDFLFCMILYLYV